MDSELTSTGTILGSPFYMSPEQSEGKQVDGRTDIYSLGVIFYETLTGEHPYEGESAIKVITQHLQCPLPKLPEKLSRFQPLINSMMAKDRDKRLANATELVTKFKRLIEKEEDSSEPSPAIALTQASIRRAPELAPTSKSSGRPWVLAGSGTMMFALGLLTLFCMHRHCRTLRWCLRHR